MKKILVKIIILLLVLILALGSYYFFFLNKSEQRYVGGDTNFIEVLNEDLEVVKLVRGVEVEVFGQKKIEDEVYRKVVLDDQNYYIKEDHLFESLDACITEKEVYVNLPSVLYADETSSKIIDYVEKEVLLEVIGYTNFSPMDGSVERYKVNYNGKEAFILSKNVALEYEESVIPSVHLQREDLYGGGEAYTLEYPTLEPFVAKEGVMPETCNTLYINGDSVVDMQMYIDIAKRTKINAFVIDIRDSHLPSYASNVAKEYSPTTYNASILGFDEYKQYVKMAKDEGIYLIGRITVFKDTNYALDHPEDAIIDNTTQGSFYYNSSYWPSAFDRDVWHYNIEVAKEAVVEMGFDEIQFDYTRFPDRVDRLEAKGAIDLRNEYDETKAQAIQRFLMYATDELHALDTYVSVDVFGETANAYVTAYGQYWPAISNVVDVISAMPYPDHFADHDYGISEYVWEVPYKLLLNWSYTALNRQKETPNPAVSRTWIQGYDAMREPYVVYDNQKILDQITALEDAGFEGGYIVWNAASSVLKYKSYENAFNH